MKLIESILNGSRYFLEQAVENGEDPSMMDNYPIRVTCEKGDSVVLRQLLTYDCVDPTTNNYYPIRVAASNKHVVIIKMLLKDSRINYDDVITSASNDHPLIIDFIQMCKSELRDEVIDSIL